MPKITDPGIRHKIKEQIRADFSDGLKVNIGPNPPEERLPVYRSVFEELAKEMNGEELKRFELFGQLCGIILPPFARKTA